MENILVLGLGNRLMRDDAVGIYVVENLSKQNFTGNIRFAAGETDVDYCLDEIEDCEYLIIIDAAKMGGGPGEAGVFPLRQLPGSNSPGLSLHNCHLIECLKCLNNRVDGVLIGIEPEEILYGFGLSPVLNGKLPQIVEQVTKLLKKMKGYRGPE